MEEGGVHRLVEHGGDDMDGGGREILKVAVATVDAEFTGPSRTWPEFLSGFCMDQVVLSIQALDRSIQACNVRHTGRIAN
jgi:hypothetical protein